MWIIAATVLLLSAGALGTLLPFLPGTPLIFAGALLYAWHTGFETVSRNTLIALFLLMFLGEALEKISAFLGAKKFGATRRGLIGVLVGGIGGLLLGGPLGLAAGPFLGAFLFEFLPGRSFDGSLRAAVGAFVGLLGGMLGKFLIALAMIGVFLHRVLS